MVLAVYFCVARWVARGRRMVVSVWMRAGVVVLPLTVSMSANGWQWPLQLGGSNWGALSGDLCSASCWEVLGGALGVPAEPKGWSLRLNGAPAL